MLRAHVNEVDIEAIDLRDEVRHGIEPRFDLAPVVLRGPVAREFLHGRERHALRKIGHGFFFGQPGRADAPAQIGQLRFRNVHLKGRRAVWSSLVACKTAFIAVLLVSATVGVDSGGITTDAEVRLDYPNVSVDTLVSARESAAGRIP
jgi:hypothetical protein